MINSFYSPYYISLARLLFIMRTNSPTLLKTLRRPLRHFSYAPLGDFLIFILFISLQCVYLLALTSKKHNNHAKRLGKATGKLLHMNAAILLLFVQKQALLLKWILHRSMEEVIHLHRWIGVWETILVILHGFAYTIHGKDLGSSETVAGWIAGAACILLFLASLPFIRRMMYHRFFQMHVVLSIFFFIFSILHYDGVKFLLWMIVPLGIHVVDWVWRIRSRQVCHMRNVKHLEKSDAIVFEVRFEDDAHFIRNDGPLPFVFVNIGDPYRFEWHPFSTLRIPDTNRYVYRFCVRNAGVWSNYAIRNCVDSSRVVIEGVFGGDLRWKGYDMAWIVGAGSGSIPTLSLFSYLMSKAPNRRIGGDGDDELSPSPSTPVFSSPRVIHYIWIVRNLDLVDAFCDVLSSEEWDEKDIQVRIGIFVTRQSPREMEEIRSSDSATGLFLRSPNVEITSGRPHVGNLVESVRMMNETITGFVSGPIALIDECQDAQKASQHHPGHFDLQMRSFKW